MSNKIIYPNSKIGKGTEIGEFCIIGETPKDKEGLKTVIGKNGNIRSHAVIYFGNIIGDNFQTGHAVNIREENKIGNNVSIGTKSIVEHHVLIEDDVRIHSAAFIPEFTILRKGCWIGPGVFITNARYPKSKFTKNNLEGVEVGENAKIGANSTILPGVKIGKNALIGAGSVVSKDVPPDSVVCGNPAKFVRKVTELKYKEGKAYE